GLIGKGRLAEPEEILNEVEILLSEYKPLKHKKILITSGPTREPIDPVRFISNHSTGKMGQALAEQSVMWGAQVTFISGPTALWPRHSNTENIAITSADEMYDAVYSRFGDADIIIYAAAVADYTPIDVSPIKIKKKEDNFSIALTKTKDIAFEIGQLKKEGQIMVGFALETNDALENAKTKLNRKNLDLIVLNSLSDLGSGFGHDTNKVTILDKKGRIEFFELKSKQAVAKDILESVIACLNA
ncbi:MAG TPA: bifunctional phosphopantothenoylcysteine decarboxylase/phosphopantothenate--cysteine ligase CoaBC, partial [Cytophagales bacterium]|nr:bifunctional phosphopantothenoylcysteine decarboxylase/phosphopantothenate--cysteine ligase CoaBC [Cytophagales bacterium]